MRGSEPSAGGPGSSGGKAGFEFETRLPAGDKGEFFQKLRAFAAAQKWPVVIANEVELIFEEWITDVMDYGVDKEPAPFFRVELFCEQPLARLVITDNGIPFDPTALPAPDVRRPAEERPIGGLGIFMMRSLCASMSYERRDDLNILTICKSLREPALKGDPAV